MSAEKKWTFESGGETFELLTVDDSGAKVPALTFFRSRGDNYARNPDYDAEAEQT